MRIIDLSTWDRTGYYLFFKRMDYAHYNIGADLEITNYIKAVKRQGLKFSFAMTYAATCAMNLVEAFRYRMRGGEVVLHDKLHPSFTYLAPGEKYFKMVTTDLTELVSAFVEKTSEKALRQEKPFVREDIEGRDDLIYISSIPWVSFTHLSHTISFNKGENITRETAELSCPSMCRPIIHSSTATIWGNTSIVYRSISINMHNRKHFFPRNSICSKRGTGFASPEGV